VPKYDDFRACNDDLLHGDGGSGGAKAMEDPMDVLQVLPDELANAGVLWDGVVTAVVGFVTSGQPFDGAVIDERVGDVWNFRGEEERDVVVEDCDRVSPSLWKAGQLQGADGGLHRGEVTQGDVESPVIVANEKVKHGIACPTSHGLYDLVSERWDTGVTNGDSVEWL